MVLYRVLVPIPIDFPFISFQPGRSSASKSPKLKGQSRTGSPSGKKKKGGKKKSASAPAKSERSAPVDMLNPAAMSNLYYIAHSAVDALELRGFGWSGGSAGSKKGKGKKGKKKK